MSRELSQTPKRVGLSIKPTLQSNKIATENIGYRRQSLSVHLNEFSWTLYVEVRP